MTQTEIAIVIAFASLVVERLASHALRGSQTEQLVRKLVDQLVADLRREHAECRRELAELRELISVIHPIHEDSPAE